MFQNCRNPLPSLIGRLWRRIRIFLRHCCVLSVWAFWHLRRLRPCSSLTNTFSCLAKYILHCLWTFCNEKKSLILWTFQWTVTLWKLTIHFLCLAKYILHCRQYILQLGQKTLRLNLSAHAQTVTLFAIWTQILQFGRKKLWNWLSEPFSTCVDCNPIRCLDFGSPHPTPSHCS